MKMSLVTAGVTSALGKAKTSISNFATSANQKLGSVAKLVSMGLTAAFVAFAKKAIDYGSAMSDMAEQNRISTDALQVLSAVALKAGVGIQDITRAMRNANIRTQEAIDGNTKYKEALERLNLNLTEFSKLPTERKLEEIAKAYKNAGKSQQAYTDVAVILGTKAGPKMLEVLKMLSELPPSPAIIAPTIITDEIALVTDIKGVCKVAGTLEINSKPRNMDNISINAKKTASMITLRYKCF